MKTILLFFFFIVFSFGTISMQETDSVFFVQCYFDIPDKMELLDLEGRMRENPNIKIVRLDYNTQRAFILTKKIENIDNQTVISWFEEYGNTVFCINKGVYGVDKMKQYPFEGCVAPQKKQ